MFETKTDSSTLQAVFMNDTKEIHQAVKNAQKHSDVKTVLNKAAREEAEFQKRPADYALAK